MIFISFKDIKQSTYDKAYAEIIELIRRLYEEHRYFTKDDILSESEQSVFTALLNGKAKLPNVNSAIKQLSLYMERKFQKNQSYW